MADRITQANAKLSSANQLENRPDAASKANLLIKYEWIGVNELNELNRLLSALYIFKWNNRIDLLTMAEQSFRLQSGKKCLSRNIKGQ